MGFGGHSIGGHPRRVVADMSDGRPAAVAPADAQAPLRSPNRPSVWTGAVSGLLAAAVALAVAELMAGLLDDTRSLVLSIGDFVTDSVPGSVERWAIATMGTADKPILVAGILVLSGLFGALLGRLGTRRFSC